VNEAIRQNKLRRLSLFAGMQYLQLRMNLLPFSPLPGADSTKLANVQGKLLDQQFKDVLTPGTSLYKHWCQQLTPLLFT
jgi:hypothetical protein